MKTPPPFITTSNTALSRWQSAVAHVTHQELLQNQPGLRLNDPLVRQHPRVLATNLHVDAVNKGQRISAPDPLLYAGKAVSETDTDLHFQAYASQAHWEAHTPSPAAADTPASLTGFPYSDYAISAWLTAATEYVAAHPNPLNPTQGQPYNDWTIAGKGDIDYGVIAYTLPANAKVAVIGDYGTGLPDAIALVETILSQLQPDCILHIGDIYYAGMDSECQATIVDVFQTAFQKTGVSVPVFSIPGNHEYMGGGSGFYTSVLPLNTMLSQPADTAQAASYFCLRTEDNKWQFLGMDTGFYSVPTVMPTIGPPLHSTELQWMQDKLENFQGNTILLSHHQLFSATAEINGSTDPGSDYLNDFLLAYFRPYFSKVAAWFWGHEHSLGIYEDGLYGLPKGRLVGNSGYEEAQSENAYASNNPLAPYATPLVEVGSTGVEWNGSTNDWNNHACALIDFADTSSPAVTYYQFPVWVDTAPDNPSLTVVPNGTETLNTSNPYFCGWNAPLSGVAAYATTHVLTASITDGAPETIVYVSGNGTVFALNSGTGAVDGSVALPNESGNELRLLVANQSLFVSSASGWVYCLTLDTSMGMVWSSQVNSHASITNLAFGNGQLYVGFYGDVASLDPATGNLQNKVSLQWDLTQEVRLAVNGSYVYAGVYGNVFFLDASTLDQLNKVDISGNLSVFNLLVVGDNVYGGSNGYVYGWSADGSASLGTNDLTGSGNHEVRLATDGSFLYAGTNGMVASLQLDNLAYNPAWDTPLVSLPDCATALDNAVNMLCSGGQLYIGCFGNLLKLDAGTGAVSLELSIHGYEVPISLNGNGICAVFTGHVVTLTANEDGSAGTYVWESFVTCVSQDSLT